MKKILVLLLAMLLLFTACGETEAPEEPVPAAEAIATILNPAEYVLYQNIFYNQTGSDYVGKEQSKAGIFTTVQDRFNGLTRYYVWGYNDQTKCCDWQWEFVPQDAASLPPVGSHVRVTGIFNYDEAALDNYWITDASVETITARDAASYDCDLTTMGDTLERVQLMNFQQFSADFEGKTIRAYGRVDSPTSIKDPYYDGSWTQPFRSTDELPAIGTMVILTGVCRGGEIADCTITITTDY